MTIVEARVITGGVDTHADMHVAAALDSIGGLLGVEEFPVTPAGYAGLLGWLGGFGAVALVGIEGTGSYGAGLARHVTAAGIGVVGWTAPTGRTAAGRASPTRCCDVRSHVVSGYVDWRFGGCRRLSPGQCPRPVSGPEVRHW